MYRFRRLDLALLLICGVLALAAAFANSFCATLKPGDPRRSGACTAPTGCVNQTSDCSGVTTASFFQAEFTYETCRTPPYQVCYKCCVLTSTLRCVNRDFYMFAGCIGYVCTREIMMPRCQTDFSGC
ncbi:MAG: hypothetical protein KatS3mg110_3781 [Pirellulaceae bacterium]|nr:MAG: hypothetical protein KatS3mg110_3768 [Pirellulaceae bacterium]GIW95740.1 MAG: hypothetical protein KatS3mg110_3781 [Pirellulaceae bacterium]